MKVIYFGYTVTDGVTPQGGWGSSSQPNTAAHLQFLYEHHTNWDKGRLRIASSQFRPGFAFKWILKIFWFSGISLELWAKDGETVIKRKSLCPLPLHGGKPSLGSGWKVLSRGSFTLSPSSSTAELEQETAAPRPLWDPGWTINESWKRCIWLLVKCGDRSSLVTPQEKDFVFAGSGAAWWVCEYPNKPGESFTLLLTFI